MSKLKAPENAFFKAKDGVLLDKRLSLKAKGLYMAMLADPCGRYEVSDAFSPYELLCCDDGRDSIRAGLKELMECGHLEIIKRYANETLSGHIEYEYILK